MVILPPATPEALMIAQCSIIPARVPVEPTEQELAIAEARLAMTCMRDRFTTRPARRKQSK